MDECLNKQTHLHPSPNTVKGKGKGVPVHVMNIFKESRLVAPLILNLDSGERLASHLGRFTPLKKNLGTC